MVYHSGQLTLAPMSFTLHTEPDVSPPEFTLTCRSEGGPVTTVLWERYVTIVGEDSDHETSQVIVYLSANTVYENRLRVRGREEGSYRCTVSNDFGDDSQEKLLIYGKWNLSVFTMAS